MNTITLLGDYRDLLFFGLITGFVYFIIFLHQYYEVKAEEKENRRLFYTKEERDELIKKIKEL